MVDGEHAHPRSMASSHHTTASSRVMSFTWPSQGGRSLTLSRRRTQLESHGLHLSELLDLSSFFFACFFSFDVSVRARSLTCSQDLARSVLSTTPWKQCICSTIFVSLIGVDLCGRLPSFPLVESLVLLMQFGRRYQRGDPPPSSSPRHPPPLPSVHPADQTRGFPKSDAPMSLLYVSSACVHAFAQVIRVRVYLCRLDLNSPPMQRHAQKRMAGITHRVPTRVLRT